MLYTFISDQCRTEARKHGQLARLEKIASQFEKQQVTDNLSSYPPVFLKEEFGKSYRLIIGKVYDGEDELLIFWHFWPRGGHDYQNFINNHEKFIPIFDEEFSPQIVGKILAEKRQAPPVAEVHPLQEEEKKFLYQPLAFTQTEHEYMILESKDWVSRTHQGNRSAGGKDFAGFISELNRLVLEALVKDDNFVSNDRIGVLYYRFPARKVLFLIAPVFVNDQSDIDALINKYDSLQQSDPLALLRAAQRAYPDMILGDEKLWVNEVQRQDQKANLALSQEEAELLQQTDGFYPLFINGRPGSGKSTVLQYLFAEYLFQYAHTRSKISPPIYLTYSAELLDIARKNVAKLLTSNAVKLLQQQEKRLSDHDAQQLSEHTFWVFRDYLMQLLPDNSSFQRDKYISYPRFRRMYDERFSRHPNRDLHAMTEIAWHVIRTYIKGNATDTDAFMDPDAYREFPEKQKSVTQSAFELIHAEIWENWYRPLFEQGYWDDQDLARAVLNAMSEEKLPPNFQGHSVVFCDEAQDFTRNELRLILRLSVFSRRKLTPDVLNRIPFAFAGDPFQTINPTGFDWKRTKENLYRIIRDQIDRRRDPQLDFNYKELTFNYRSQESIVQLCNFIHLLRGIAFRKDDLTPQETWRDAPSNLPSYFDVNAPIAQTYLRTQETNVIIVPCHEGEELDYVEKDALLSSFALSEDGNKLVRNIFSPMRAKGQEFDRVVLYKFGDSCTKDPQYQNLLNLIDPDGAKQTKLTMDEQIPLEYFINRLYVAASRAQKRVIIVDTQEGLDGFWCFFRDVDLKKFTQRYESIQPDSKWDASKHLVRIQPGNDDDWEKDSNDPAELAEQFMQKGKRTDDAYLLERAAQNYRLAGKENKAIECEAMAYEIKREFLQAGNSYQILGKVEKAEECFWKARAFSKIVALKSGAIYYKAAFFMESQHTQSPQAAYELHEEIGRALNGNIRPDEVWGDILIAMYKYLLDANEESALKPYQWEKIYQSATAYRQKHVLPTDATTERQINLLRARSVVYPEKLEVLQKIGAQPREIIELYKQNKGSSLASGQADIVFDAWRKLGQWDDAEKFAQEYPAIDRYSLLLVEHLKSKREYRLDNLLLQFFIFLTKENNWNVALDFVNERVLPIHENMVDVFKQHNWGYSLDVAFIKALSVSDELAKAERSILNRVSGYLSSRLLERASAFYTLLTIAQAGAALERANKIMDCLEFYENVWEKQIWPATDEDKHFARQRWLICKNRQKEQLANTAEDKKRIQREILNRQKEWKIEAFSHLPAYPQVDLEAKPRPVARPKSETKPLKDEPVAEVGIKKGADVEELLKPVLTSAPNVPASENVYTVTEPEPIASQPFQPAVIKFRAEASGQVFDIELSRERGKMTIRKQGELEAATVTVKTLKMQGSDDDFSSQIEAKENKPHVSRYFIRPWNLTCVLRKKDQRVYADLYLGEKQIELCSLCLTP